MIVPACYCRTANCTVAELTLLKLRLNSVKEGSYENERGNLNGFFPIGYIYQVGTAEWSRRPNRQISAAALIELKAMRTALTGKERALLDSSGIRHVDDEGQVEIPQILFGILLAGCQLEQLRHILSFAVKERGGLDFPLIALAADVDAEASDLHIVHLRKVVRVHVQAILDAARVIKKDRKWAIDCSTIGNGPHITTELSALADEPGPHQLISKRRGRRSAIRAAAGHGVAEIDERFSLRRRGEVDHVQLPISQSRLQDGRQ